MIDRNISLYVHMPWCIKKCPYCDFNSHQLNNTLPEKAYLQALIRDLKEELNFIEDKRIISSIFFGGGTPSLISPQGYEKLIKDISSILTISSDVEITMETNPGTTEHMDFADYKSAGINRISLGVQSFQNDKLSRLGRIHKSSESHDALEKIISARFDNFNIDLMHTLPEQSTKDAVKDIQEASIYKPTHISWYQLTLEPNTNFYHNPPTLPSEDIQNEIAEQGEVLLQALGFDRYEISAYAKESHYRSKHNLNYWQFGDYIGIGAGAHGKITNSDSIIRTTKRRHPSFYLNKDKGFTQSREAIDKNKIPMEFMLNSLRLLSGFSKSDFEQQTKLPFSYIIQPIEKAISIGLLCEQPNGLFKPTKLGIQFHNNLLELFLEHESVLQNKEGL